MAKQLGMGPDSLIRARPDPKQKWKLPVKYRVCDLYEKRFGPLVRVAPIKPAPAPRDSDEEIARRFEQELYWEDYLERNSS